MALQRCSFDLYSFTNERLLTLFLLPDTQHKVTQYKAGKVRRLSPLPSHYPTTIRFPSLPIRPQAPRTKTLANTFPSQPTGLPLRPRKTPLRPQTIGLRWPNKTCLPQESQDNKEGGVEAGVHAMQDQGTIGAQAMQAF